ncbi:uncharacterized protein LOC134278915 [Saccostrea cucullata]|uniref:uncharacterized protein LOC134278915 n=1 Tax=Saccostrea cuccullata TaxID=36930 RepID=UPI002ED2B4DE
MSTQDTEETNQGEEDQRRIEALLVLFVKRLSKGFLSGVGLYSGVKVISALMRNPFREKLPSAIREIFSIDCLRFASFLGLYPSIYELLREILQHYRKKKDGWNNMAAGGLAGLTLCIEDPTRRLIFCLFAISRAIGALISTLVAREKIPEIPYSETMSFCCCCAFLVYCTALNPQLLNTGYYFSVLKWSRDYTDKKLRVLFREPGDRFLTCQEAGLHKDQCLRHAIVDWVKSFPAFAKLYFPIHVAPVVVFRRKLLLERPYRVIKSILKNTLFSTAFLATMVMLAKYVICLLRNLSHKPPPLSTYVPAVAGFVCGFGVLFERASRRKELSLFLVPHTLYALYLWAKQKNILRDIPFGSTVLFAVSMVSVMHAYEREPESLSLLLNGVLRYFIGERTNVRVRIGKRVKTISEMLA